MLFLFVSSSPKFRRDKLRELRHGNFSIQLPAMATRQRPPRQRLRSCRLTANRAASYRRRKISSMELRPLFSQDPSLVLNEAGPFLASQPVLHNLILSILHARVAEHTPGRYWMALQRNNVI